MNTSDINFAHKVRHALNESLESLPASSVDKLATARKVALSRKKTGRPLNVFASSQVFAGRVGNFVDDRLSWIGRLGIAAPLLAGALLFVGLYQFEQQQKIRETADIDVAVLSDDLPLTAYLDHGFNAYLDSKAQ
jgi:hypothetical protein